MCQNERKKCMSVCVSERERENVYESVLEREKDRDKKNERDRKCVYVCVCLHLCVFITLCFPCWVST